MSCPECHNSRYGYHQDDLYELYDQLPQIIRREIAESDYHWRTDWILNHYNAFGSAAETIAHIRDIERKNHKEIAVRERRIVIGKKDRPIYPGGRRTA